MNFLPVKRDAEVLTLAGRPLARLAKELPEGDISLGVRPEHLSFVDQMDKDSFPASILSIEDHGSVRILELALGDARARMKLAREKTVPSRNSKIAVRFNRFCYYLNGQLIADENAGSQYS
jgi:glycerol transport system ATP-binding protein